MRMPLHQIAGFWCYATLETLAYIAVSDRLTMAALGEQVHVCPLVIRASGGVGLGMVGL